MGIKGPMRDEAIRRRNVFNFMMTCDIYGTQVMMLPFLSKVHKTPSPRSPRRSYHETSLGQQPLTRAIRFNHPNIERIIKFFRKRNPVAPWGSQTYPCFQRGHMPMMKMPQGIVILRIFGLCQIQHPQFEIIIDCLGDHIKIKLFSLTGHIEHVKGQTFRRRIRQPIFHAESVTFRFLELLVVLIQKEFVRKTLRRNPTQNTANGAGQFHRINQVFVRHLIIQPQPQPTGRPIRFPLQLAMPIDTGTVHICSSLSRQVTVPVLYPTRRGALEALHPSRGQTCRKGLYVA
ncbi:hypothetical protein FGO68_gene6849 [Halteria grandinella]|uniref:Uncharacterized protein n=1 Tax=Halteria grandinella TaxID=5974 RepID=A0A8J8SVA4_HALGN|nr:hypothetical protein FGO68_gene6849 [Halteria grandinella]